LFTCGFTAFTIDYFRRCLNIQRGIWPSDPWSLRLRASLPLPCRLLHIVIQWHCSTS